MSSADVSIIIPVRNDRDALTRLLAVLAGFSAAGLEVIVVDGQSSDGSIEAARAAGVRVMTTAPGRGIQLNAGARAARGRWLWMLHADSLPGPAALTYLRTLQGPLWGRFSVAFEPVSPAMRVIAAMMNLRSRLTGICTGDQALFVEKSLLEAVGGVPEQALMEDVELSRRLKRLVQPACAAIVVPTSARRWQRFGVVRTVLDMWLLRVRYWLGTPPDQLARAYYGDEAGQ